ncbi:hypothetical protein HPB47_004353 [Ixodes persulcatus]|uniref:Uncharacterized protein n=1 Tax=Ixodes persulcatus TaxID=34615 RepID=A0AC60PG16_IXOPE|nr:hypothetical protein HPB47_004353 [Ixodes persulcatus]
MLPPLQRVYESNWHTTDSAHLLPGWAFAPLGKPAVHKRQGSWEPPHLSACAVHGASPTNTLRLLRLMKVQVICSKTFFNYQRAIFVPAVEQVWINEQGKLLEELNDQPLDLASNGRCDSAGCCAKYLTYSMHVPGVNKILHFEPVQVGESEAVRSSGLMEKEGLIRCLAFTREKELSVQSLTTDRHRCIAKHMREKEPAVRHYFDVWHVSRSVKKGLSSASKSRDCGSNAEWVQPAVNHLYWCAVASRGDPDLLVGAWTSMTRHVVDIHTDHPGIYAQCLHDPDRDGDWLVPDSTAHARFTDVVANKSLLKDLRHLSPETQTYGLESFHSVLNRFAPKSTAFSTKGMLTRTRIATLHWNENANREQAVTQAGQLQFKVKSPKARKGHHTPHPEKTKATHATSLIHDPPVLDGNFKAVHREFSRGLVNIGGPHAEVLAESLVWTNFWLTVWVCPAGSMVSAVWKVYDADKSLMDDSSYDVIHDPIFG